MKKVGTENEWRFDIPERTFSPNGHPMIHLASETLKRAGIQPGDTEKIRGLVAQDISDFRKNSPWGFNRDSLPQVLIVGRIPGPNGFYDYFVARPLQPERVEDSTIELLLKQNQLYSTMRSVSHGGEKIDILPRAFLLPHYLDLKYEQSVGSADSLANPFSEEFFELLDHMEQRKQHRKRILFFLKTTETSSPFSLEFQTLRDHLDPYGKIDLSSSPGLFLFRNAFNNSKDSHPFVENIKDLRHLNDNDRHDLVTQFLYEGLDILGRESANKFVRLASQRLRHMLENSIVGLHITSDVYKAMRREWNLDDKTQKMICPTDQSIAYLPNEGDFREREGFYGTLLVPNKWIEQVFDNPWIAELYLIYAAQLARDDFFGMLRGSEFQSSLFFRQMMEIPNLVPSSLRAKQLVHEAIGEIRNWDQKQFGVNLSLDKFLYEAERYFPGANFYDDPPGHQGPPDGGPGKGGPPENDLTLFPGGRQPIRIRG